MRQREDRGTERTRGDLGPATAGAVDAPGRLQEIELGLDAVEEDAGIARGHRRLPPMMAAYAAELLPNQGAPGSTTRPTTVGVSTASGSDSITWLSGSGS